MQNTLDDAHIDEWMIHRRDTSQMKARAHTISERG